MRNVKNLFWILIKLYVVLNVQVVLIKYFKLLNKLIHFEIHLGYGINEISKKCEQCQILNCKECDPTNYKNCLTCVDSFTLITNIINSTFSE